MKIAFRISFLGQNFYGTQKLNNKRTIQGVFEEVLSNLYDQKIKVAICSRLDRKVNATDFVLSFIAPDERFDVAKLHYVVSRYLGKDIHVIGAFIVPDDFHPRGSCLSKTYKYSIQNGDINPLYNNFTFTPIRHIDEDRFIEALNLFNRYQQMEEEQVKNYERRFGPLTISSRDMMRIPFAWEATVWPWEM